jgi:hypothetical protein
MNRLYVNHAFEFILLSVAVVALSMFASVQETCEPPAADSVRVSTDAPAHGAKPNNVPSHCLVYGKYCLGESLHGR